MAKFLIGTQDGKVRSAHNPPLNFSISGRYVIDVPQDIDILATTDSVPELLFEKISGFKNRPAVRGLTLSVYDELLAVPNVDSASSNLCFIGPNKRCAMFPGGTIVTEVIPIYVEMSQIYFHWYGFTLWSNPGPQPPDAVPARPDPPQTLYNYDPAAANFTEFNPDDFTVEVRDSTNTSTLLAASYEAVQSFSFGPGDVRLRFTNSSDKILYLSDWLFLHDSVV